MTAPRAPAELLLRTLIAAALSAPASAQVRQPGETAGSGFDPERAVFSRYSSDEVPDPADEPLAEDLAPELGLVRGELDDGVEQWIHEKTGMRFVFVPGGPFKMGSDYSNIFGRPLVIQNARANGARPATYFAREQPAMQIYLSPYFIGAYEVTVGEYRQFMKAAEAGETAAFDFPLVTEHPPHEPFLWNEPVPFWDEDQPITGISWLSAYCFSGWMGGRLPTEAEWEKAAKGGDDRIFPWGDWFDPTRANVNDSLNNRTLAVGTLPGGRSPYGCYDMAGNVLEYTLDAWEETIYRHRRARDPCLVERAPPVFRRVVRGGSWNMYGHLYLARTTAREPITMAPRYPPLADAGQYLHLGFRVALSRQKDLYPPEWLTDKTARIEELLRQREREEREEDEVERRRGEGDGGDDGNE